MSHARPEALEVAAWAGLLAPRSCGRIAETREASVLSPVKRAY